jgi:YgiT-type zinc finger domain-containing protein
MIRKSSKAGESLRRCPTCGSTRIRTVVNDYRTHVHGEEVVVPDLERHECPDCDEVLFGPAAMRRMESYRKNPVKAG